MWSLRTIVICLIYCACRCKGQEGASNATEIEKTNKTAGFPKCCEMDEKLVRGSKSCAKTNSTVNYEHNYFYSNATHIDDSFVKFIPTIFYKQLIVCPPEMVRALAYHDEVQGFNYNSSLVVSSGLVSSGLISTTKYCVDSFNGRIAFLMCHKNEKPLQAQIPLVCYLSFLIISTLCCFGTAVIYPYMMKTKEVHRKCFVGYSFSTGFAILFEIMLQTEMARGGCNILGVLFFFFTIASFVWLACLCLDLIMRLRLYQIILLKWVVLIMGLLGGMMHGHLSNSKIIPLCRDAAEILAGRMQKAVMLGSLSIFVRKNSARTLGGTGNENRFKLYIGASLAVPSIVSLITLLANDNKPAVPDSFIKPSDGESVCKFKGELSLFFVPVGFLVLVSLAFLAYFFYLRRQNETYHKNDLDWVMHRSKFNYMFSQCLTLFMVRLIFYVVELLHTFLDASFVETTPVTVLKIISSLEGFFILLVFVVHCLRKKQWRKERIASGDYSHDQRVMMRNFLEH